MMSSLMCLIRPVTISSVAFAYGGQEIVASYVSEQIYSFHTVEHARQAHAFLGWPSGNSDTPR